MKKIRAAVVGYGNIGRFTLEALEAAEDFEVAGIVRRHGAENKPAELANYEVVKEISELKDEDVAILRMFRLCKESRFEGRVHEHMVPLLGEAYAFTDYVHHFGYAYASEEEKGQKARRNLQILLPEYEKNPEDLRLLVHLVNEYHCAEEKDEEVALALRGIELCAKKAGEGLSVGAVLSSLLCVVLDDLYRGEGEVLEASRAEHQAGEGLKRCEAYRSFTGVNDMCLAVIAYYEVLFAAACGRPEIAQSAAHEYETLRKYFSEHRAKLIGQSSFFSEKIFDKGPADAVAAALQLAELKTNIETLIAAGKKAQAGQLLQMLVKMYPSDGGIQRMLCETEHP